MLARLNRCPSKVLSLGLNSLLSLDLSSLLSNRPSSIVMVQLLKVGLALMVYRAVTRSCPTMPMALRMCLLLHRFGGLFSLIGLHLLLHLDLHQYLAINHGPHGCLALSP